MPSWRIEPLELDDGSTLIATSAEVLDSLPEPHARVLTPEHRVAMADPRGYFSGLASQSTLPGLKRWLEWLARAESWELHLTTASYGSHSQHESGIVPIWQGHRSTPLVRLRQPGHNVDPESLRCLYELIWGTYSAPFEAGGIEKPWGAFSLGEIELRPPILVADPSSVIPFFNNGCGDLLLAEGGRAIWFLHETSAFVDQGPLLDVVNAYFHALVDGTSWGLPDPYETWRRRNPGLSDD